MAQLLYQAVCYTCGKFVGPRTNNQQQALNDRDRHQEQHPNHNVDVQVTQVSSLFQQPTDEDDIQPFEV
jgi:hypothetical protein